MSTAAHETRFCRLEQALGADVACPEDGCPFWEAGGAVLDGRCAVEGLDVSHDRDLAAWLLGLRKKLELPECPHEAAGHEFRRLLNESLE